MSQNRSTDPSDDDSVFQQPVRDCKELFDELFFNDQETENLQVKKPTRTYAGKRKGLLNKGLPNADIFYSGFSNGEDDDDDEDEACDSALPQRGARKKAASRQKKAKQPRKKKAKAALCTKEAVLKAYREAIEKGDLPDFDEIDKVELCVTTEPCSSGSSQARDFAIPSDEDSFANQVNILSSTPVKSTSKQFCGPQIPLPRISAISNRTPLKSNTALMNVPSEFLEVEAVHSTPRPTRRRRARR